MREKQIIEALRLYDTTTLTVEEICKKVGIKHRGTFYWYKDKSNHTKTRHFRKRINWDQVKKSTA